MHKHPEERGFELAWLVLAEKRYLAGTQGDTPRQAWDFYLDDTENMCFFFFLFFFFFSLLHTSASPAALTHAEFSCRAALVQPIAIRRKAQHRKLVSKSRIRSPHFTTNTRTKHQTELSRPLFWVLEETRKAHKQRQTAVKTGFALQKADFKAVLDRIKEKRQKKGNGDDENTVWAG